MIVACGGDGTIHEVINGMLFRSDKKRVPIAIIPNGSGNDMAFALKITDVDIALNYIIKGHSIKVDTLKINLDYENDEDIPEDKVKISHSRYAMLHAGFNIAAKVNAGAKKYKNCCGGAAY
jgi:diacylglycerol kinase family enzyme